MHVQIWVHSEPFTHLPVALSIVAYAFLVVSRIFVELRVHATTGFVLKSGLDSRVAAGVPMRTQAAERGWLAQANFDSLSDHLVSLKQN